MSDTAKRRARAHFIVGYIHGRASLDNHDACGREAQDAFERWWLEVGENAGAQGHSRGLCSRPHCMEPAHRDGRCATHASK